jgi:hypothetical protein
VASENRINELIIDRNALADTAAASEKDVKEGIGPRPKNEFNKAAVITAKAELELASIARQAFGLPEFPECSDAVALEVLFDFLGWLEKKDSGDVTPSPSPASSVSTEISPTNSSSPCI